jgi:hypothetical protein
MGTFAACASRPEVLNDDASVARLMCMQSTRNRLTYSCTSALAHADSWPHDRVRPLANKLAWATLAVRALTG